MLNCMADKLMNCLIHQLTDVLLTVSLTDTFFINYFLKIME